jgi:hypothetical membrane protein
MDQVRSKTPTDRPAVRSRPGAEGHARVLAAAGILGPIVFTVGFAVQDLFRSQYNPIAQQISELTAGRDGWIQQANFVLFGLLMIAFAVGLHRVRVAGSGAVVPTLVAWNGAELMIAGVFPLREDAAGRIHDPIGVHSVNGKIFFLSIGVGLILMSRRFAHDASWRGLAAYALATGVTLLVMFAITGVLARPAAAPLHPWSGVLQRAALAVWLPCVVVLALRLRRVASTGVSASTVTRNAKTATSDRESTTGAPRWVRAFLIIGVLVLILLFAIEHLVFERLPGGDMGHMGKQSAPAELGS